MIQGQSNDMLLLLVCTDSAAAQHRSTHTTGWLCDELSADCRQGLSDNSNRANYKTVFPIVSRHSILVSRRIVAQRGKLLCFMRCRHWPTQQIHPVDWITSLKLKPIEFKWDTKKPESDCRASRYLKDNDKLKTM